MSKFEIITDSSCNLAESIIDKLRIHILSLSYIVNDVSKPSYKEGEVFDYKFFYNQLRDKVKASTSQVTTQMALDAVRPLLEVGQDVLYVGFSSGLSGTYEAVAVALEELKLEFPERTILYEDTLTAALGQAHFVLEACRLRDEGKTIEEAHKFIADNKQKLTIWFTVDDLFHLKRGGRISAGKAIIGSALGVKPILKINEQGKLVPADKAKGRKKSLDYLVNKAVELALPKEGQTMYIVHGDCEIDANYVRDQIKEKIKVKDIMVNYLEPVIAVHAGPGVVGLIFTAASRG